MKRLQWQNTVFITQKILILIKINQYLDMFGINCLYVQMCHLLWGEIKQDYCMNKANFIQGAVLLQRGRALSCLAMPLPLDLLHRVLFVSGSCTVANGLKCAFTQGTVSPSGWLVPKHAQRRQRRRKLAHGPNLPRSTKLLPTSVKIPVEINWIHLTAPRGSAVLCRAAAKQCPV